MTVLGPLELELLGWLLFELSPVTGDSADFSVGWMLGGAKVESNEDRGDSMLDGSDTAGSNGGVGVG